MTRTLTIIALGSALLLMTAGMHLSSANQVEELQEKRIALLTERVDILQEMTNQGQIGTIAVTRSQIDLLDAKLEYADSDDQRKDLINQLLEKHDAMIEIAEMQLRHGVTSSQTAHADLLLMKSERVGLEIKLAGLQ